MAGKHCANLRDPAVFHTSCAHKKWVASKFALPSQHPKTCDLLSWHGFVAGGSWGIYMATTVNDLDIMSGWKVFFEKFAETMWPQAR
jgi:hypothetical protein